MGIVTNLHPGRDRLVRSVNVRISSGRELRRPIEKLYPLELQVEIKEYDKKTTNVEEIKQRDRPMRLAAQRALEKIQEQSQ